MELNFKRNQIEFSSCWIYIELHGIETKLFMNELLVASGFWYFCYFITIIKIIFSTELNGQLRHGRKLYENNVHYEIIWPAPGIDWYIHAFICLFLVNTFIFHFSNIVSRKNFSPLTKTNCVCVKRITLCNCLCSSSLSSRNFASVIRNIGKFGAKNYFTDHKTANTI